MRSRLKKGKLLLAKSFIDSENGLVREIMERVERDDKNLWNRGLRGCLERLGMDNDSLRAMSKEQVKQ